MYNKIVIFIILIGFSAVAQVEIASVNDSSKTQIPENYTWSLQECLAYAKENSLTVLDAELDESSAQVNYEQSKQQRLPSLTGSLSESFNNGYSIDPITSDYVNQQIYSTSTALSTSVTLYQGSQLNNQIKQNKLLLDQNSLFVQEAKNNITLSITEAYLNALYYKEAILTAQNTLDGSAKEVEVAKARYEAGSIAKKDYSDVLSQQASNKYNLITAQNNYDSQLLTLKQLLEIDGTMPFEIEEIDAEDEINYAVFETEEQIYNNALENLPSIKAQQLDVEISEKDIDIAKGGFLPTLSFSGSLGSGYTSTQDLTFSDQFDLNFNQRVGLSLSIPIFSKGQNKAAVQNAKINVEKSKIALRTVEKELYQKVDNAWRNSVSAQEQLSAAKVARDASYDAYQLAQKQYDVGAINTTDLVLSQNTYTNAQQTYTQAKYLSILYKQLLEFYQGNEINL